MTKASFEFVLHAGDGVIRIPCVHGAWVWQQQNQRVVPLVVDDARAFAVYHRVEDGRSTAEGSHWRGRRMILTASMVLALASLFRGIRFRG